MRKLKAKPVDTKLVLDVIFASLIVQKAPAFINRIFPLDPTISQFAGVGAGYVAGIVANRPGISDASLALGAIDFISPVVDNITSGTMPVGLPIKSPKPPVKIVKAAALDDYVTLNEYVDSPGNAMGNDSYASSY